MAGVAIRDALQIVLVLWLGFPEVAQRRDFRDNPSWPQARRFNIGNRALGSPLLLIIHVEDCRAIALSDVVALTVQGRRIVNLKEELQQFSVAELRGVEDY